MTHPHVLWALAALWSLDRARSYLVEHRETILIRRPQLGPANTRPRSLAQLAEHDALLRDERPDRHALAGAKMATGPAPVAPGLLDLDRDIRAVLADVAALLAHVHRNGPMAYSGHWDRPTIAGRWLWLTAATSVAPPGVAREIQALVEPVDGRARSIAGRGPDRIPAALSPRCPACRLRLMQFQTSAPQWSAWTLVCGNTSCWCLGDGQDGAGDGCPCDMPVRAAGVRHIWASDSGRMAEARAGARLHASGTMAA